MLNSLLCASLAIASLPLVLSKVAVIKAADRKGADYIEDRIGATRYTCQFEYCHKANANEQEANDVNYVEGRCLFYDQLGPDCGDISAPIVSAQGSENIHCPAPWVASKSKFTIWRSPTSIDYTETFTIKWNGVFPDKVRVFGSNCVTEEVSLTYKGTPRADCWNGKQTCAMDDLIITTDD